MHENYLKRSLQILQRYNYRQQKPEPEKGIPEVRERRSAEIHKYEIASSVRPHQETGSAKNLYYKDSQERISRRLIYQQCANLDAWMLKAMSGEI